MKLGNLVRTILSAGAISILAPHYANAQGLESLLEAQQNQSVNNLNRTFNDVRPLFLRIYDKIKEMEFEFRQDYANVASIDIESFNMDGRHKMAQAVSGDLKKLLAMYGIDYKTDGPYFDGWVMTLNDGFLIRTYGSQTSENIIFRSDGFVRVNIVYDASGNNELKLYSLLLEPTQAKPQPLDTLVHKEQQDTGFHYFDKGDFDGAYRAIRELTFELDHTNRLKDTMKWRYIQDIIEDTAWDILESYDLSFFGTKEIRASDGGILIHINQDIRDDGLSRDLVIWPYRIPTLTINHEDGTPEIKELPQVIRSYRR